MVWFSNIDRMIYSYYWYVVILMVYLFILLVCLFILMVCLFILMVWFVKIYFNTVGLGKESVTQQQPTRIRASGEHIKLSIQ